MPLGLGPGREFAVGEERLQPEDWLADFLEREAAAGYPPPETVRRLIQAVSEHQDGRFQDDATVLARWNDPGDLVP
jgi:hypothetical protein